MDHSLPFRSNSENIIEIQHESLIQYKNIFIPYIKDNKLEEAKLFFENNYKFILNKFDLSSLIIDNFKNTEEYITFIKFILKYNFDAGTYFLIKEYNKSEEELLILFSFLKKNIEKKYSSVNFIYIFKSLYDKKYFLLLKKFIEFSLYDDHKLYTNKLLFTLIFKYELHELYEDILNKHLFNKKNDDFLFNFCINKNNNDYRHDILDYNEINFKFSDENIDLFILKYIDSLSLFKNSCYDINYKKIGLIHYFSKYDIFIEYAKNHSKSFEYILKYNDKLTEYKCDELISIFEKIKLKNEMNNF